MSVTNEVHKQSIASPSEIACLKLLLSTTVYVLPPKTAVSPTLKSSHLTVMPLLAK